MKSLSNVTLDTWPSNWFQRNSHGDLNATTARSNRLKPFPVFCEKPKAKLWVQVFYIDQNQQQQESKKEDFVEEEVEKKEAVKTCFYRLAGWIDGW